MVMIVVSEEQYFRLHDGRVIKNLDELRSLLEDMEQSLYEYHVTVDRNDFSNWIRDVLNDSALAEKIRNALSPKEMVVIIDSKIADDKAETQRKNREKIKAARFIYPVQGTKKRLLDSIRRTFAYA